MTYKYWYNTRDNVQHSGIIRAGSREAVFERLRRDGVRPCKVEMEPTFSNSFQLFLRRWGLFLALFIVSAVAAVRIFTLNRVAVGYANHFLDSTRRQIVGDAAVIERGIQRSWSDVFANPGERFLAAYALPGTLVSSKKATEDELLSAMYLVTPVSAEDTIEVQQIKSIVAGMKDELREYVRMGGTCKLYIERLKERQDEERSYYEWVVSELKSAESSGLSPDALIELWMQKNGELRQLGIRTVPMPEICRQDVSL